MRHSFIHFIFMVIHLTKQLGGSQQQVITFKLNTQGLSYPPRMSQQLFTGFFHSTQGKSHEKHIEVRSKQDCHLGMSDICADSPLLYLPFGFWAEAVNSGRPTHCTAVLSGGVQLCSEAKMTYHQMLGGQILGGQKTKVTLSCQVWVKTDSSLTASRYSPVQLGCIISPS